MMLAYLWHIVTLGMALVGTGIPCPSRGYRLNKAELGKQETKPNLDVCI